MTVDESVEGPAEEPAELTASIRAILLATFASGTTTLRGLSGDKDSVRAAIAARTIGGIVDLSEIGTSDLMEGTITGAIPIDDPDGQRVFTTPLAGWSPDAMDRAPFLDCGGSKTTAGMLLGLIAGYFVAFRLYGNEELSKVPFSPLIRPLISMGARVARATLGCRTGCGLGADWLPLLIKGWAPLQAKDFVLDAPLSLVKDAIILAGLRAEGTTRVTLPQPADTGMEKLLSSYGVEVRVVGETGARGEKLTFSVEGPQRLRAPQKEIVVLQQM